METVNAAKVVRAMATLKGQRIHMYNDKRTFGHSIKVWNWSAENYMEAMDILLGLGYNVKMVRTPKNRWSMGGGNKLRLHIKGA